MCLRLLVPAESVRSDAQTSSSEYKIRNRLHSSLQNSCYNALGKSSVSLKANQIVVKFILGVLYLHKIITVIDGETSL
jgi:hypothetical protein